MKKKIFTLLVATLATYSSKAQNNIDLNSLPPVADLMVQVSNPSADTIILCSHGGPTSTLGLTDFSYYHSIPTFSTIYVKQYQQYNTGLMGQSTLSLADAIICNDTAVAIMRKVVNHFNNLGKTVVITGHSFGAFLIPEYLDDYGNTDIHRVIPMAGRLNMNDDIWNGFATGYLGGFSNDGIITTISSTLAPSSEWAGMKLMAGFGYNRHIDSLSGLNLNNLMYLYGESDQSVGRLLPNEVTFLQNVNATVIAVPNGDHGSMFSNTYMDQALAFIRGNNSVGIIKNEAQFNVKIYPTIVDNCLNVKTNISGTLMIYNSVGQVVYNNNIISDQQVLDLSHFDSGVYIVVFVGKNAKKFNQKIIVR
jgi:hypothetical protein